MKIGIGSMVFHPIYGKGQVVDEWGVWRACRRCYAPKGTCGCGDKIWIDVSGRGTFEVMFEHEQVPINRAWLRAVI